MPDQLLILLAAAAVASALPLLWWSVASARPPVSTLARDVDGRPGATTNLRQVILRQSARERAVQPLLVAIAARTRRVTPAGLLDALERRIFLAGQSTRWPLERILAAKLLLGLGAFGFGLLQLASVRSTGWILGTALAALGGYFLPDAVLWSRARQRQQTIRLELPDTLDQMTIAVEAGLGFEAAMARAAHTGEGPLAEELVRALQEVRIGIPRSTALRNLTERTDVPELRQFVLAVLQAETYGIPIAQVLRVQASELRVKRRQRAEERAMKIPVKVVFPLVTCILPSLFVIVVGPAVVRIARDLFAGL